MLDASKDDEEMDSMGLLGGGTKKLDSSAAEGPDIPFCGCLSVRFYQPYFDVDTDDVVTRISHAVFYCRREQNFMATIGNKPDVYGPFWVLYLYTE